VTTLTLASALDYVRQPTTILGISTLAATAAGYSTGEISLTAALPGAVFGLVSILIPETPKAAGDAQAAAAAVLAAAASKTPLSINTAVQQLVQAAGDLAPTTPVVAVPPAIGPGSVVNISTKAS
jgi:hypothetical protein